MKANWFNTCAWIVGWVVAACLGAILFAEFISSAPTLNHLQTEIDDVVRASNEPFKPDCRSRKDADLCAQIRMADAAESANRANWQGLYLLCATLLFTAWAARATVRASKSAAEQVKLSHQDLISTQRAFVFPKETIWMPVTDIRTGEISQWEVVQRWENSGSTPTRHLKIMFHRAVVVGDIDLPPDYEFADSDRTPVAAFIGPGHHVDAGPLVLLIPQLEALCRRELKIYTWGWAEYDDVLEGTPRHRTEFCYRWIAGGNPRFADKFSWRYELHQAHNATDDECTGFLRTSSPKHRSAPQTERF